VLEKGFMPRRLYFAIERFRRWFALNQEATFQAQAATLAELYDTYNLMELEEYVPETRTRFFVNTVFERSQQEFRDKLEKIIKGQRDGSIRGMQQLGRYISSLQADIDPESEDLFFLTRLSFPHLTPTDSAALISLESGGTVQTDLVVQLADYDGGIYSVRTPVNPKEITRLHQLFLANNLSVEFRPEHRYLVAINDRNQLIGGVFYRSIDNQTVHIEKIVVTTYYRKKGVSDGILNEFFKRARNDHFKFVTTGFFRPEYFYRFGFKIERKYAGLVKILD
jgi:long-chain acyl-CoA synthetase